MIRIIDAYFEVQKFKKAVCCFHKIRTLNMNACFYKQMKLSEREKNFEVQRK